MQQVTKHNIYQYFLDQSFEEKEDLIIKEHLVKLEVNDNYYTTFCCTPSLIKELIIGNLAVNKYINTTEDLDFVEFKTDSVKVIVKKKSHNIKNSTSEDFIIEASQVLELMNKHLESSPLHKITGGTHIMSLANNKKIIYTCQDVGRHNALDKLYGCCLRDNIKLSDKILLSSGRITNEICHKAVRMGIKMIVSRAAVTSLAIDLAIEHGITLVGFARTNRFNIYTNPYRILE